jgi:hypothetical protein
LWNQEKQLLKLHKAVISWSLSQQVSNHPVVKIVQFVQRCCCRCPYRCHHRRCCRRLIGLIRLVFITFIRV